MEAWKGASNPSVPLCMGVWLLDGFIAKGRLVLVQ